MAILQLLNVNYLNSDYNHTIDFADADAQEDYFDALVNTTIDLPTIDDYVYIRENKRVRVGIVKSDLDGVNYLRFNNGSKWWYAFITSKEYVNENCTDLIIEIDVFQTFMFDYTIKESYISRQHEDRWNGNNPVFNLKQEDINLGSNVKKTQDTLINDTGNQNIRIMSALVVASKPIDIGAIIDGVQVPILLNDGRITDKLCDPLYYYLLPIVNDGFTHYTIDGYEGLTLRQLSKDIATILVNNPAGTYADQVVAYKNIISISILPYLPIDYGFTIVNGKVNITVNTGYGNCYLYTKDDGGQGTIAEILMMQQTELKDELIGIDFKTYLGIPAPNKIIGTAKNIAQETKLYTDPYTYFTLDDNQAQPFEIKPQNLDNLNTTIGYQQSIGDKPISKYYVNDYLGDSGTDNVMINNNDNNVNIVSDKLADYYNERRASSTTGLAINTMMDIGTNVLRTAIGLSMGNPFAISNAIGGGSSTISNIMNEAIKRQDLSKGSPDVKSRSNNINAIICQYGNKYGLHLKKYEILPAFKQIAYELFYHYGYACRDFLVPNLKSRYYFNYIKAPDMCLDTGIDNEYITKLKSIFANGITIWHYRDANTWQGVENYQYENIEMSQLN